MAKETDKWIQLISKLRELTASGSLRWHSVRLIEGMPNDLNRKIATLFESNYKGHNLRLYELSFDTGTEHSSAVDLLAAVTRWQSNPVLELVDENGSAWQFPNIKGLEDLLETVKFQAAGIKDFIEAVLADETARP